MKQLLLSAVVMLVLAGMCATAEAQQLAQAVPVPPQQVISPPPVVFPGNHPSISRMEEELESLEAHRDTKKAYVKATEVGVRAAQVNLERIKKIALQGAVSNEEVDRAVVEVEAARAQVEIRMAEMKEVEVKIKYARKRLEEAKSGPKPFNPPKPGDPPKFGPIPKPLDPPKLADPPKFPDPPKIPDPLKLVDPKKPIE
jgi:hypothetical protein